MIRLSAVTATLATLLACSSDGDPFGPDNLWYHATDKQVPEEYMDNSVITGTAVGDVLPDFVFLDQHGDEVQLYQFYGQVVQLVLFAQWCGPCQAEAPEIERASVEVAAHGAVILEVMIQGNDGPSSVETANEWVTAYSGTHPVLADTNETMAGMLAGGFPTLPLLDRELRVVTADNWPFSADAIVTLADATAPEDD